MGENELYWNATGLAVDSVLCGCDDLECIEKRQAADEAMGLASDSVLQDFTPEVRHELRMVSWGTSLVEYCPCGWVFSNDMTFGLGENVGLYSERYREHLEDAANAE